MAETLKMNGQKEGEKMGFGVIFASLAFLSHFHPWAILCACVCVCVCVCSMPGRLTRTRNASLLPTSGREPPLNPDA